MKFLKEQVFTRKNGTRNVVSLLLGVLVFVFFVIFAGFVDEEIHFMARIFGQWLPRRWRYEDSLSVPICISFAVLGGAWICRFGEKRGLRWLLLAGFSFLDAIPLVNLIAPLVYRHKWKKAGEPTDFGEGLRGSLRKTVHRVLVEKNAIFHPDGKLKFGLIRFVFVAVFRIIRGVFCLLGVLFVPAVAPVLPLLGWILIALVGEYDMTIAEWVAGGALILSAFMCVIHPVISALMNPKKPRAVPAYAAASVPEYQTGEISGPQMPAFTPAPEEPVSDAEDPDDVPGYGGESVYDDAADDEIPACGEDPVPAGDPEPAEDVGYTTPAGDKALGMAHMATGDDFTTVPERNEDREIANYKEKDI